MVPAGACGHLYAGKGAPVPFIHDNGGHGTQWKPTLALLAREHSPGPSTREVPVGTQRRIAVEFAIGYGLIHITSIPNFEHRQIELTNLHQQAFRKNTCPGPIPENQSEKNYLIQEAKTFQQPNYLEQKHP